MWSKLTQPFWINGSYIAHVLFVRLYHFVEHQPANKHINIKQTISTPRQELLKPFWYNIKDKKELAFLSHLVTLGFLIVSLL